MGSAGSDLAGVGGAALGLLGKGLQEAAEREQLRWRVLPVRFGAGSALFIQLGYVSRSCTHKQVLRERRDRRIWT